ncbi:putative disease resistance protein [Cinnamomum micranthum f. kanehirae]|uniref:Putative disease resistance protein n=1 Tax=Cinnamomum micranthum f. kanehirae TaxID=337451 RepID=A0A3S3PUD8_9MAGN|nr:putative disease resistance protein [Cinnamomum micranthum f. kanehirae]
MDMIIRPVLEIVKLAWGPIGRQIGYIKNLERNLKELNKHKEYLDAKMIDLEEKITREISKVATRECNQWLKDVKDIEHEVSVVQDEYKEDKKCLAGWCPNVCSKMKLGKHVEEIIKEITTLNDKRSTLEGRELSNAPLEKVQPQNVESISLTATERTLKEILMFIEDDNTKMIGVWGMGGVGKTTTMKLLNNRLEGSPKFEIVIWVTVSKAGNRRNMQNAIAERLELTKLESDDQLKASICKALRRKKFLLLLDDVWKMIDLFDVGIPPLNQVDGCKVVLTTRSLKVCQQMKTNKDVKVETLSEDEAWNLFITSVGDVAMTSDIKQLAGGIVKECGGLPLAINVVGSSLRNNGDVVVWRNTLRELQLPTTSENEDMEEQVFSCLRSSYDKLQDDSKKKLFLYCSLYPEDSEILITELVEYCWLEGYIHGVGSIEVAHEKGHSMVMNLVDASLLERGRRDVHVKMHDVVRDFALREALEENEWLLMQKISLMKSNLCNLLERPNCSTLSTLLLQDNDQLTMIPDPFFECMHSLCILDLSRTEIKSLPSSLWNVVNLRGLYLKDCLKLKELSSQVGALKKLEVLDLGGNTAIRYLPREVGKLTRLKRLIVGFQYSKCSQYDGKDTKEWNMKLRVPTGIIPKLSLLEELSLYVYPFKLDIARYFLEYHPPLCAEKEQWDDESMEVVVEELCGLEHLTYLDAYFPKVECLEHFLRHSKSAWFRRFRFRVGTEITDRSTFGYCGGQEWERCLVYKGGLGMSHAAPIMETLAHSSFFHLQDHRTARKLSELGLANMNELKECRVESCEKMEALFDGDEQQETCALLPNLESLRIENLPELRSLCHGPLLPGSLSKLRHLHLSSCNNLKKVFQLGIIRQLCSLEELDIRGCSNMEEIIEIEEEEMSVASHTHNVLSYNNDTLILPNIKEIRLRSLPELVSICRGFSNFEWPSLETIDIVSCPKLKSLSFLSNGTNIVAPALRQIYGQCSWWEEELEWEDNDIKQRLQPFHYENPNACIIS